MPRITTPWTGRAVARAREYMATHTQWPATCGQCGKDVPLEPRRGWVVGHIKARATHPQLTWERSNWRIEHRRCSDRTGQAGVIAKAQASALKAASSEDNSVFPDAPRAWQSPPLPASLSEHTSGPVEPLPHLKWSPAAMMRHAWLRDLLPVPDDASPPLLMTPVPDDAVCSYGWAGCEHMPDGATPGMPWIEANIPGPGNRPITLRWWQRLKVLRRLEHRADGTLCHREVVSSGPRRIGKSVELRGSALWRMEFGPDLFGEVQNIIHTGSDMNICREIQRGAWLWAERKWGHESVTRANGKEAIEATNGSRWLVRAQDGVYGYDVMGGLVDEGWDVKPDTVTEGLEPATMERSSPQLDLTSTAHRRATSLMPSAIADASAVDSARKLLLLWGAPAGADSGDPAVWRAASPHWSEDRAELMAAKYRKAAAGELDPELDDPDPMKGFESQYLNVWHLAVREVPGTPIVDVEGWERLAAPAPSGPADAVAVEAWFADGVSVARAWRTPGGPVVVDVEDHPDIPTAARAIAAVGTSRQVLVGASLAEHAAWKRRQIPVRSATGATRAQVADLIRYMAGREFRHARSESLTEQVLAMRTSPGTDGPRIRSTARADAIKAAMWAVAEAAGNVGSGLDEVIFVTDNEV